MGVIHNLVKKDGTPQSCIKRFDIKKLNQKLKNAYQMELLEQLKLQADFIKQLQAEKAILEAENQALKEKQTAFQDEMLKEIERIEKDKTFFKIFQYGKLLFSLIATFKAGIEKYNAKK